MIRTYFEETFYDMQVDIAQKYAEAIREALRTGQSFEEEKKKGFFLSMKGTKSMKGGFEDKLYVGNIHRIEDHLYWRDEELADDDQIVNVVVIDGPVTRDGDGCSYGSKDHRDQILNANTIPQVVGHIFIINTPGGAASARIDYEQAIADCREKGKPTVAWVDGMCCSAGQLVAAICDRTIVMNGRHTMGCIGTMCAFWGVANGTVDKDGYRYIELVSVTSPDKNAEYREACDGKTEKLQAELDKLGEEFRETVRQNRPRVKEEHLTGKTFDADEVMGELVDEIGDYSRAIQAVFDLSEGAIPTAREIIPDEEAPAGDETHGEQEELAKLNEQQKAAVAANAGDDVEIENGHVKKEVTGFFGPTKKELAKPSNDKEMTEQKKQSAEAEAAKADAQEAAEQPAGEAQPAAEEQPAGEEEPAAEEQPAGEEEPAAEEQPAGEEEPAGEEQPASEEAIQNAQEEIDKMQETLKNAEALVEQKDKEIADLKSDMEGKQHHIEELQAEVDSSRKTITQMQESFDSLTASFDDQGKSLDLANAAISERDQKIAELQATIDAQKQQLADKEAEIKELAGHPTPMTSGGEGIPAGNATGEAPKAKKRLTRDNMTYDNCRKLAKKL